MPDLRALLAQYMIAYGGDIGVKSATLIKVTPGTRTPGAISAGTNPTTTSYPCSGWIALLTERDIPGTEITQQDRKLAILGGTLPAGIVPLPQDKVTMVDLDGTSKTFVLVGPVGGDSVGAVFAFQARAS